jgi:CMP-2-keto-3-deoxyoctulosonic acid synthetase
LENIEKIEILRLIENRISVDIVELFDYFFTIDTNEDVLLARSILEK